MSEQRARVKEWRITRRVGPYVVRYWIESDPEHGGVSCDDAVSLVHHAEATIQPSVATFSDRLARRLIELLPSANSVEVCHGDGNGTAVHRDWP